MCVRVTLFHGYGRRVNRNRCCRRKTEVYTGGRPIGDFSRTAFFAPTNTNARNPDTVHVHRHKHTYTQAHVHVNGKRRRFSPRRLCATLLARRSPLLTCTMCAYLSMCVAHTYNSMYMHMRCCTYATRGVWHSFIWALIRFIFLHLSAATSHSFASSITFCMREVQRLWRERYYIQRSILFLMCVCVHVKRYNLSDRKGRNFSKDAQKNACGNDVIVTTLICLIFFSICISYVYKTIVYTKAILI